MKWEDGGAGEQGEKADDRRQTTDSRLLTLPSGSGGIV